MLAKNIVRINGYKGLKRTHVDIEVKMQTISFYSGGKLVEVESPAMAFDIVTTGFANGLDAVTSENHYNWCSKSRITSKIL